MCIRDSYRYAPGLAGSLRHLTAGYVAKHSAATAAEHRFAGAGVIWPVSYTHLDVYKRQAQNWREI